MCGSFDVEPNVSSKMVDTALPNPSSSTLKLNGSPVAGSTPLRVWITVPGRLGDAPPGVAPVDVIVSWWPPADDTAGNCGRVSVSAALRPAPSAARDSRASAIMPYGSVNSIANGRTMDSAAYAASASA